MTEPPQGLAQRAARGALVTVGAQLVRVVLQVVSVVVLARLLTPGDYGLVAMVLIVVGVGEIFRDFGLSSAAVQAPQLSNQLRSNLFWLNTAIGALMGVVVFATSPLIAAAFGQPALGAIARWLSVVFVINGLTTQYRAGLTRDMRFGALGGADILCQLVGLATAIFAATAGAGYWALVIQQIVSGVVLLLLLAFWSHWLPGRLRRTGELGPLVRFGGNLVGTQLINYLSNNVDSIVISARFSPVQLGLYTRAFQLLMNPLSQLRSPATMVALPVLSRLQQDPELSGRYIRRGQIVLGYVVGPAMAVAIGAAHPLVSVLLGPQWLPAAPVLALLAVAGLFQTLAFVGYWIYLSRGLTASLLRFTVITATGKSAMILVGSLWGLVGVAAGYALSHLLEWPFSLWWLSRVTPIPVRALLSGALRITAVSAAGAAGVYGVCLATAQLPPWVVVLAAVGTALVTTALIGALFGAVRQDVREVFDIVRRVGRRGGAQPAVAGAGVSDGSKG